MGTTCNSIHVLVEVGFGADELNDLVRAVGSVSSGAFVSPELNGWVSVYSDNMAIADSTLAAELSVRLKRTVVDAWCFDSDIAGATVLADGAAVAMFSVQSEGMEGNSEYQQLVAAGMDGTPEEFAEMMGIPLEELVEGAEPLPRMFGEHSHFFIGGVPSDWIAALNRGSVEDFLSDDETRSSEVFADMILGGFLELFGISADRSLAAHRWIEDGEVEDHASFIKVP